MSCGHKFKYKSDKEIAKILEVNESEDDDEF